MYTTILKLLWPYLQRYLAKRGADYIQSRRERRNQAQQEQEEVEILLAQQPELLETIVCPPPKNLAPANAVWFTMAGVLLGGALTFILQAILRSNNNLWNSLD